MGAQIGILDLNPACGNGSTCRGCMCNLGYGNEWCEHAQRHNCPLEDGDCKGCTSHNHYRMACAYYKPNSLKLEDCLSAVLQSYDDGTKLCSLIESVGCAKCYEAFEEQMERNDEANSE